MLTSLPSELQLHILAQLDLISLLNATATNHYFHSLLSRGLLKGALLTYEATLLEKRQARWVGLLEGAAW